MNSSLDRRVLQALGIGTALTMFFYAIGYGYAGAEGLWYLLPNLALAYIPLLVTYPLLGCVGRHGWRNIRTVGLGAVWLGFLPNSFYMLTDIMHIADSDHGLPLVYAVVVFGLFGFLGMAAGFLCVYFVHREMLRRLSRSRADAMVLGLFFLTSVGIYLGRTLRWNTWDLILHPVAVLRDTLASVLSPTPEGAMIIGTFFVLLSGLYWGIWWVVRPEDGSNQHNRFQKLTRNGFHEKT